MKEKLTCETCKHFFQHYVPLDWEGTTYFTPCASGHCGYPRIKLRRAGTEACDNYEGKKTV